MITKSRSYCINPSNLKRLSFVLGLSLHLTQFVDLIKRCSPKLKSLRVPRYFFTQFCKYRLAECAEAIVNSVPQLVSLNARDTPPAAINVLAGLRNLKSLSISLHPDDIGLLSKFKNLECLNVESTWIGETESEATNCAIESVIRCLGLTIQKLNIFGIFLTPKNALLLPQVCPNLRILLITAYASDELFYAFKSLKHLKELTVCGWEDVKVGRAALLSDGFFEFLDDNKTLTYLLAYGVVIKDFSSLSRFCRLRKEQFESPRDRILGHGFLCWRRNWRSLLSAGCKLSWLYPKSVFRNDDL